MKSRIGRTKCIKKNNSVRLDQSANVEYVDLEKFKDIGEGSWDRNKAEANQNSLLSNENSWHKIWDTGVNLTEVTSLQNEIIERKTRV